MVGRVICIVIGIDIFHCRRKVSRKDVLDSRKYSSVLRHLCLLGELDRVFGRSNSKKFSRGRCVAT